MKPFLEFTGVGLDLEKKARVGNVLVYVFVYICEDFNAKGEDDGGIGNQSHGSRRHGVSE